MPRRLSPPAFLQRGVRDGKGAEAKSVSEARRWSSPVPFVREAGPRLSTISSSEIGNKRWAGSDGSRMSSKLFSLVHLELYDTQSSQASSSGKDVQMAISYVSRSPQPLKQPSMRSSNHQTTFQPNRVLKSVHLIKQPIYGSINPSSINHYKTNQTRDRSM